ncbi:hypothetical protein DL771_004780 [Monosporascus sp. 5C6A]|nr:hypothetical protein DL771_004780 [Monosporascus sp. 5C6A]
MPKWDKTRNYYADLELQSTASTDDIKKQYRKLAMKWHPDRNRGNEKQASIAFQTIQTAYEILVDDVMKREYDNARGAFKSRYPAASGVKGNPWQDIGRQYPRPPTRPAAPTAQSRPSGAYRYASDFGTMPRTGGTTHRDDPRDHYTAWQSMRPNGRGKQNPPPTPGRAPTSAARDKRPEPPKRPEPTPVPPRTASQRQKAEASFGARRSGYVPRSPGLGDEPPVTSKNYFTTRTHSHLFTETPEGSSSCNEASQSHSTSTIPDPLAKFRETYMDVRQSSPYHTVGGEKTRLFEGGPGLDRTTSTRTPPRKPEMPGTFPRPRSSSTPKSAPKDGASDGASMNVNFGSSRNSEASDASSTAVNTGAGTSAHATTLNRNAGSQSQASNGYKPNSDTPDTARPVNVGNPPTASATSSKPATANAQSAQNDGRPSVYDPLFVPPFAMSRSDRVKEHTPEPVNWLGVALGLSQMNPSSEGAPATRPGLLPVEELQRRQIERLLRRKATLQKHSEFAPRPESKDKNDAYPSATKNMNADANYISTRSFSLPVEQGAHDEDPAMSRFAKSSTENINTSFVQGEQAGGWRFTAGSPISNEKHAPPVRPPPGTRPSPPTAEPRPVTTNSIPRAQEASSDAPTQRFSAGEWSEKIGSEHFVPPPSASASTSPTRRANSRKTKPVKMTAGTAGMVDSDESEGWPENPQPHPGAVPAGPNSPTAMDIDVPPLETADGIPKASQTHGARNIPVEPTRPDWRAGDVNSVPPKPTHATTDTNSAIGTSPEKAGDQSTSVPTTAHPFTVHNGGSEDSEEFRTTLSDLKKTEPFMDPAPMGLKSFADLKSTLPFDSRPSERIPVEKKLWTSAPLEFPIPPVAPRLPQAMTVKSPRPTLTQWRKYAQDFYNYMDKWESFNAKVVEHFSTRQKFFKQRRQEHGAAWLDNAQDAKNVEEYMTELRQDQEVRKKWADACDIHQTRVREFMDFRERIK